MNRLRWGMIMVIVLIIVIEGGRRRRNIGEEREMIRKVMIWWNRLVQQQSQSQSQSQYKIIGMTKNIIKKISDFPYKRRIAGVGMLIYVVWIFIIDRNASRISNRKSKNFINNPLIRIPVNYLKHDYFPAVLVRDYEEEKLDPNRKYIILLHPHGIISVASMLHFIGSDAFPELNYRLLTISFNFFVPFIRELFLKLGLADVSNETIRSLLRRNISVAIVVGGAQEALDARPGTHDLTLATRVGFAKLALEEGADIIPVFTFGENDLFSPLLNTEEGSWYRNLNENWIKKILTFVLPIINPIPKRKPIHTIIGKPIPVPFNPNATLEDVLALHYRYTNCLQDLYDRYKHLYPQGLDDLKIIDKVTTKDVQRWQKNSNPSTLSKSKL